LPPRKASRRTTSKRSSVSTVEHRPGVDQAKADRVYAFFEGVLKHSKGQTAGQPFRLLPWQKYVLGEIFGRLNPDGTRQYRQAYIEIPKKNGKSTLLAGICLYCLLADGEPGAEIFGAACDREQAGIIYREMASMVRASPALSKVLEVVDSRKTIIHRSSNSLYRVLSADSFRQEGLNIHACAFDEVHAQRGNRALWDALRYGGAARRQPLCPIGITTAGEMNTSHLWWDLHTYAEKCAADPAFDPTFFGAIYAADRKDDWKDPKTWYRANPSLGETISEESFRADCRAAENSATQLNAFLRYRLNIPTSSDVRWLRPDQIGACNGGPPEPLEGRECWCGLDLASTYDTTAFVAVFPDEHGHYDVLARFWIPEHNAEERSKNDRVDYMRWAADGEMTLTEGKSTDYKRVKADILAFAQKYRVRQLAIDRWNATAIATELADEGLPVTMFGQGFASMTAPTRKIEGMFVDGKLRLAGNKVLNWQLGNAAVQTDPAGNVKVSKQKSTERIDGVVALIMAAGVHMGESMKPADLPEISFW
jgi:phage terminase large subunit-like protein